MWYEWPTLGIQSSKSSISLVSSSWYGIIHIRTNGRQQSQSCVLVIFKWESAKDLFDALWSLTISQVSDTCIYLFLQVTILVSVSVVISYYHHHHCFCHHHHYHWYCWSHHHYYHHHYYVIIIVALALAVVVVVIINATCIPNIDYASYMNRGML